MALLSVKAARERILTQLQPIATETLPLIHCANRVLAQDIAAATDLPLFDNSVMDGFALRSTDTVTAAAGSNVTLSVVADIPAGANPQLTLVQGQAARCKTDQPSRFRKPAFTNSGKCFTNHPRWCKMRACWQGSKRLVAMRTHG